MTDVVDKPDGSEFENSPEVLEQVNLLDVIGVNDISPGDIRDTWTLAPSGLAYVARYDLLYLPRADALENHYFGVEEVRSANERVLFRYFVTAAVVNKYKELAGVEDGFEFTDYAPDADILHTPATVFSKTRGMGYWTVQAPAIGEPARLIRGIIDRNYYAEHDRKPRAHLIAAMAATHPQVEFGGAVSETIENIGRTNPSIAKDYRVMLSILYDRVFGEGFFSGPDLRLRFDGFGREDELLAFFSTHQSKELIRGKVQSFISLLSKIAEDTGYDPEKEQKIALEREARLYEFFARFV